MLKTKIYGDYLVQELNIMQFMPIMSALSSEGANDAETTQMRYRAQLDMLAMSLCNPVTKEPIGDEGLTQIGASEFLSLWNEVAGLHGLLEKKESDITNT